MSDVEKAKKLLDAIGRVELRLDDVELREGLLYYRQRMNQIASTARLAHVIAERADSTEMYAILAKELLDRQETPPAFLKGLFDKSGVTEALDSHLEVIRPILMPKHLPPEDVEFLRQCGLREPESEIIVALAHFRHHWVFAEGRWRPHGGATEVLQLADDSIRKIAQQIQADQGLVQTEMSAKPPAKKRKIFNGIGKILSGVVGGTGNVLIGTGAIPVSGGASVAAVVASAAVSIGIIMQGIGDLRGE